MNPHATLQAVPRLSPAALGIVLAAHGLLFWALLRQPSFDRSRHEGLMVDATPLSARKATHPGFVGFDLSSGLPADPILIGPHHAGPELVEYLEGGLVARQPELPLELDGRYAGCLAGHQVGCPKPDQQRRVRTFHHGSGFEADVANASTTHRGVARACGYARGEYLLCVWKNAQMMGSRGGVLRFFGYGFPD